MNYPGISKGDILENIEIQKLVFGGKGFAKLTHKNPEHDGKTIFVTGGAIPGSIVNLRVLKKRKNFLETQIIKTIKKSPLEKKHPNNPYGESGGWRWINIDYKEQLKIKEQQVKEAFNLIEKKYFNYKSTTNGEKKETLNFLPIQESKLQEAYRNKIEFSFGKYISHKEAVEEHFNVGFHKQGEFSKVIDFDGCPLIDEEQNKIYREIKSFTKTIGLPVYDQKRQSGFFRHILIRKAYFTKEIMILLSFNPDYFKNNEKLDKNEKINILKDFFQNLAKKYKNIKSIYLSHNTNKSDTAIGDLEVIYGKKTIKEKILGVYFEISPTSFFQTNSIGAEKLYEIVLEFANIENHPKSLYERVDKKNSPLKKELGFKFGNILDLYSGTGTIGILFAKSEVQKVISVEYEKSASLDGEKNAKLNNLENIKFVNAKVEDFLGKYLEKQEKADLLIIDPPRAGMHPKALKDILKFETKQIIYVSCNVSTLTRDLDYILENSNYKIEKIKPIDMFPHTHHIETVVSLKK